MEQNEENATEEHPEKEPFVIPADDCTIVFDDLPEAVQKQLDDTPPNIADWKCCTHCGAHEEGIKFITCPQCLDCQLGPSNFDSPYPPLRVLNEYTDVRVNELHALHTQHAFILSKIPVVYSKCACLFAT
jgi:hypothetical protein